jgi:predicted aspartyl protease
MSLSLLASKRSGILCILSFCIILHGYASSPEAYSRIFSLPDGLSYTEVPFRLIKNLIIVPVTINGEQELNFLVDTGTSTPLILHKRYIKKLDLPLGARVRFQGAGRDEMMQGTVIPSMSLQIGDAYAQQLGAVVLDYNPLDDLRMDGITIHGIIGASLFYSFAVEIDYLSQIIRLHDSQHFLEKGTYSSLPMQVVMSRPVLSSTVVWKDQVHTLNLMIDTGFNHHLLLYEHAGINFNVSRPSKIGIGYSGNITGGIGKTDMLHLGERKFFDVHTYFPFYADYKAKGGGDGIIGNALLKQLCVILDYANTAFYIREHLDWQPSRLAKTPEEGKKVAKEIL